MLGKRVSGNQFFKIFWGGHPDPRPGGLRRRRSRAPPLRGLQPSLVGKACPCTPSPQLISPRTPLSGLYSSLFAKMVKKEKNDNTKTIKSERKIEENNLTQQIKICKH